MGFTRGGLLLEGIPDSVACTCAVGLKGIGPDCLSLENENAPAEGFPDVPEEEVPAVEGTVSVEPGNEKVPD